MIKKAIAKVVEREDLSEGEMIEVMDQIMSGGATLAQIGSFITALRMKGETVAEITGAARVMRERATPIRVGRRAARPSALRLTGVLLGFDGSISTTQPKRWNSFGCRRRSKRSSCRCQRAQLPLLALPPLRRLQRRCIAP